MSEPVDKSIMVSAPYLTAYCTLAISQAASLERAELPRLALILVRRAMPMPMGCNFFCRWPLNYSTVCRHDESPFGDFATNEFRFEKFRLCDGNHFRRDIAGLGFEVLSHSRLLYPTSVRAAIIRLRKKRPARGIRPSPGQRPGLYVAPVRSSMDDEMQFHDYKKIIKDQVKKNGSYPIPG